MNKNEEKKLKCFCASGGDGKDDARRLNEQLVSELNAAQDDMKRLRQAIDQMAREYEAAKDVDVFRRYRYACKMDKE